MVWKWTMGRKKTQNYTPAHEARKHLSLQPLYHSPTHVIIITTQWAGTKDKPKSGVQREFSPDSSYEIYFFKCLNRPLPSAKNINSIATVLKSIPSRLLKFAQGWEVGAFLVLPYWPSFDFSKILSYLDGGFQEVPQLQFLPILILSLMHKYIKHPVHWQNGGARLGWPAGLQVMGWKGSSLSFSASLPSPYPVSMVSSKLHETHFSPKLPLECKNSEITWGISCRTKSLYLCIPDWVLSERSISTA